METRKRKPFTDLTNQHNLIPTSTLRKLVASSSTSNSVPKPSNSVRKSNVSSRTGKLCSDSCNRSSSSVGSSSTNFGSSNLSAAWNSPNVQFSTPSHLRSSISSSGDGGTKNATCSLRKTLYGPKKGREAAAASISPSPLLEMKDKMKASSCPHTEKAEEFQNPIHGPRSPSSAINKREEMRMTTVDPSSSSLDKTMDKGKAVLDLSVCSFQKTKDIEAMSRSLIYSLEKRKGKEIVIHSPSSSLKKREEMGMTTLNPSSSSLDKIKDKGNAVLVPSVCSLEKKKDKEAVSRSLNYSPERTEETEKTLLSPSSSSIEENKDKGKSPLTPFGCSIEKRKVKGESILSSFGSSLETMQKKGKVILGPSSVEKIKHKDEDAYVSVKYTSRRRKSGKRMIDTGAFSCPPLLKTKNASDESGDVKPTKSLTDHRPKRTKKRCVQQEDDKSYQDFIEQQRAYFRAVDEFELPVEEVSE